MIYALKGDIAYAKSLNELCTFKDHFLVCDGKKSLGVFKTLPQKYMKAKIFNYKNKLIIPGLVDMHLHAPQYSFIGMRMDLELIDWLNTNTFPEEAKYKDKKYASAAYKIFANDLKKSATTRFVCFATLHYDATSILFDLLEKTGLKGYVGKVNMDRNSTKELSETKEESVKNTIKLVKKVSKNKNVKYIITPRFIPSCSDELLIELSKISKEYNLPIQSHLSENRSEVLWVKDLVPNSKSYGDAYHMFELFGEHNNTVMAHCVWCNDIDMKLMEENKVWVAHSPSSNRNLSSGNAPIREYLDRGINVGLATDVAGGSYLSMFRTIEDTITTSKIKWLEKDVEKEKGTSTKELKSLKFNEAFYLATRGGGKFFDSEDTKVGSFDEGFDFDCLVLDDKNFDTTLYKELTIEERLERFMYRPNEKLVAKFVAGKKII